MAENFPNPKKETDVQVQETQRAPNKMNQRDMLQTRYNDSGGS